MYIRYVVVLMLLSIASPLCIAQKSGIAVSSDNTLIYFKTFGAGRPLLIINGGPGMNSDGFEALADSLSKNHRTIIYDQRGTGKSVMKKLDSSTITLELMLEDIEAIRKQLDIETWSILGHSFGGMLASAYATVYPERIEKLILSSSGGIDLGLLAYVNGSLQAKLTPVQRDSLAYWNQLIAGGDTTYETRLGRGRNMAPAYVMDKQYYPVIAHRLTQGNATINQLMWDDLRKIQFDCSDHLQTFDRPVLIIQGEDDLVNVTTAETAHKAFRNSSVVYMDHCIHYGWLDNPEVYFKEINAFLGELD